MVGKRVCTMLCSSAKSRTTEWSTSDASGPPGTAVIMTVRSASSARTASTISVVVPERVSASSVSYRRPTGTSEP